MEILSGGGEGGWGGCHPEPGPGPGRQAVSSSARASPAKRTFIYNLCGL